MRRAQAHWAATSGLSTLLVLILSGVGSATAFAADSTPPTTPVISDDGAYTSSTTSLHATWSSADPESSIVEYQYLIKQDSTAGTTLVNWTSTGTTASVTRTGLSLSPGKTYYLWVKAKNGAGKWSVVGYSDGIKVDTTAPTAPGQPIEDSPTTDADYNGDGSYTIYWPAASDPESGIVAYELQENIGQTATWTTLTDTTASPSFSVSGRQHNTKYFYQVRAKNGAGLWGPWSAASDGILVDLTPPASVTVTDDGLTMTSTAQLHAKWTASNDPESGIVEYRFRLRQDSTSGPIIMDYTSIGLVTEWTQTGLSLALGSTYYIGIRAKNAAGLESTSSYSDGITVMPAGPLSIPSEGLTVPATVRSANSSRWYRSSTELYTYWANEWLEYQCDFGAGGLWVFSLTATNHNSSSAPGLPPGYAFNIAMSVDGILQGSFQIPGSTTTYQTGSSSRLALTGIHTLRFTWTNDEGTSGISDSNIQLKQLSVTMPPDTTPPSGTVTINQGAAATNTPTVTLALAATDDSGRVAQMQFSNDGATYSTPEAYAATKAWTLPSGDGTKTVYAKFADAAGNWSAPASNTILLDATGPTGSIVINKDAPTTNTTAVTLALSASDAASGVHQMQFSNDGITYSVPEAYAATKPWNLSAGDGTKTVSVKFADGLGNWSNPVSDTIVLDTTPPILSAISATNLTETTATIGWTTDEPSTTQVEYGPTPSYGKTPALDAALVTTHSVGLSGLSAGTTYHVRVHSKDAAGNEAVGPDTTFTLADQSPPSGSITINSGAAGTNSPTVTLTLSATDNSGTVSQMQCSNDGTTYSMPEPYTTTKPWTLSSGDGTKTVWVKFADAAGNWSSAVSDTIALDTVPPQLEFLSPKDHDVLIAPGQ